MCETTQTKTEPMYQQKWEYYCIRRRRLFREKSAQMSEYNNNEYFLLIKNLIFMNVIVNRYFSFELFLCFFSLSYIYLPFYHETDSIQTMCSCS